MSGKLLGAAGGTEVVGLAGMLEPSRRLRRVNFHSANWIAFHKSSFFPVTALSASGYRSNPVARRTWHRLLPSLPNAGPWRRNDAGDSSSDFVQRREELPVPKRSA